MAAYRRRDSLRSYTSSASFRSSGVPDDVTTEHHVETTLLLDELRAVKIEKFNMDGSSDTSRQTECEKSSRIVETMDGMVYLLTSSNQLDVSHIA